MRTTNAVQPITDCILRVAIYLRVSTEEQRERATIDVQRDFAQRYCDLHGHAVVRFYEDSAVSGTVPLAERPAGRRLLEDAKAGKVDLVLVYKLDRLGRSVRVILGAVTELEECGAELRSMTEPFDTSTPIGRFVVNLLSSFAELERETIIQRTVEGTNLAARQGAWLGGIVPYGYRAEGEGKEARVVVAEDLLPGLGMSEADVLRLIYRMIAEEGKSCVAVADRLNHLGVPPSYTKDGREIDYGQRKRKRATAGVWRPGRVRNMVISTTYKGLHRYGKRSKKKREPIEREVPAIVSAEQWERAQDTLARNRIAASRNARRAYLLRGLMKCARCGLTYIGTSCRGAGGKPRYYYKCNGRHQGRKHVGPDGQRCTSASLDGAIETVIWDDVEAFIRNPGDVLARLAERQDNQREETVSLQRQIDAVQRRLDGFTQERDKVLTQYRRGRIDDATLDRQLDLIRAEEEGSHGALRVLQQRAKGAEGAADQLSSAQALLNELHHRLAEEVTWNTKRRLIETLVQSIRVHTRTEHGEQRIQVEVVYRFSSIDDRTGKDSSRRLA